MKQFLPLFVLLVACNTTPTKEKSKSITTDSTALSSATPPPTPTRDAVTYETYCNDRFDYCIDYPKELLYPQPESDNGDGRVFNDKKGTEVLRVFGRIAQDEEGAALTLEQQFEAEKNTLTTSQTSNNSLTYQKLGNGFFVLSGYRDGKVFYQKTLLKNGNFMYALLTYNKSQKGRFDVVSERLFQSFK